MNIHSDSGGVSVSWSAPSTGFVLQESDTPESPQSWSDSPLTPVMTSGTNIVILNPTNNARFFRLHLN
jgi:hypothetical protein